MLSLVVILRWSLSVSTMMDEMEDEGCEITCGDVGV